MSNPAAAVKRVEAVADPATAGERADRFLTQAAVEAGAPLSRARVKALIEAGCATRDGAALRAPAEPVRAGARYGLALPPATPSTPPAQAIPLAVLFEDADLIVIDKPAGLVVHPAPGNLDGTLVNALLAHCGPAGLPGIGGVQRPGIVHRLDRDTSGVMVVAKTEAVMAGLSAAFAARDIERAYLGLCWGVPAPASGRIEGAIGRDPRDRKRMAVVARGGKDAATRYRLLRAWAASAALLECRLETGRTHQIRVHLAARGHPLLGDPVYLRRTPAAARALPEPARQEAVAFPRQALHAASLGFRHPLTGATLRFETAPPPDMAALIVSLDTASGQG